MHPLRSQARVLLVSVFGPYAQDDQYGSRVINPMELFHNQVTRLQHAFSFRSFYRSWGLMLIQVNLKAPCNLLDYPAAFGAAYGPKRHPTRRDQIWPRTAKTSLLAH